jgi:hypothetical protein
MPAIKCPYTFERLSFLGAEGNDVPDLQSFFQQPCTAGEAEHVARMNTLRNEIIIRSETIKGRVTWTGGGGKVATLRMRRRI